MDKRKKVATLLWLTMMTGTICLVAAYLAGDAYQRDRLGLTAVMAAMALINWKLMMASFKLMIRWIGHEE